MPTVVKLSLKQMAQCRKTLEIEEVDRTALCCQMSDPKLPNFGTYVRLSASHLDPTLFYQFPGKANREILSITLPCLTDFIS